MKWWYLLWLLPPFVLVLLSHDPCAAERKRLANEMSVFRHLNTIHVAQKQYFSDYGRYASGLQDLGEPEMGAAVGPATAGLIAHDLASGKKNGYTFQMSGTATGYTITVIPEQYKRSRRRSFYSDQSMVIRESWSPEPATASSEVAR